MSKDVRTDNAQQLEVLVSNPKDTPPHWITKLYICTGYAITELKGESDAKDTVESVRFWVGPAGRNIKCLEAIATGSLAYVHNAGGWSNGAFRVGPVNALWDLAKDQVQVTADVATRDSDGWLYDIAYQVFILVQEPDSEKE